MLLDRNKFQDIFALLKWNFESVTLAPLLTPEDTKKPKRSSSLDATFHNCGKVCEYLTPFIEMVVHGQLAASTKRSRAEGEPSKLQHLVQTHATHQTRRPGTLCARAECIFSGLAERTY